MHLTASTSAACLCLGIHVSLISPLYCLLCMLVLCCTTTGHSLSRYCHHCRTLSLHCSIVAPTGLYPSWYRHPLVVLCLLLDMTSSLQLLPIYVVTPQSAQLPMPELGRIQIFRSGEGCKAAAPTLLHSSALSNLGLCCSLHCPTSPFQDWFYLFCLVPSSLGLAHKCLSPHHH
jgi:hypothetical protein